MKMKSKKPIVKELRQPEENVYFALTFVMNCYHDYLKHGYNHSEAKKKTMIQYEDFYDWLQGIEK
jgi:hypothetical protein